MPKQVNVRCGPRFPARHTWVSPDVGSQLNVQALPKSVSLGKHFNKFLFSLLSCSDGRLPAGWRGRLPAYGQGAGQQAKFLWPAQSLTDSRSRSVSQSFHPNTATSHCTKADKKKTQDSQSQSKQECLVFFPPFLALNKQEEKTAIGIW